MQYQSRTYNITPGGQPTCGQRLPIPPVPPNMCGFRAPILRGSRADDDVDQDVVDGGDDDADGGDDGDTEPGLDIDDGIGNFDDIGERPSGIRVTPFTTDPITDPPDDDGPGDPPGYIQIDAAQSGVGGVVPWQAEQPGDIPPSRTTPYSQTWGGKAVIGQQMPWADTLD